MKNVSETMYDPLSLLSIDRDLSTYTESGFADGLMERDQPGSVHRREPALKKKGTGKQVRFVAMFP
jgi:hypothetical protein